MWKKRDATKANQATCFLDRRHNPAVYTDRNASFHYPSSILQSARWAVGGDRMLCDMSSIPVSRL